MNALRYVLLMVAFGIAPIAATAQCLDAIPGMSDGLVYYDRLERLFVRLDTAFSLRLSEGTAQLDAAAADRLSSRRERIRAAFARIAAGRAAPSSVAELFADIGAYPDFIALGLNVPAESMPPDMEALVCPLRQAFLKRALADVQDHARKMAVRYGEQSERLNILEMLLNEWTTSRQAMGRWRDPSPWEWIVRVQTLGYQYRRDTRELAPSFPVLQLGATHYFFGTGAFSRTLHHVGLAGAYQRDVTNRRHLAGVMLHVQEFDLGVLCAAGCRDHIVVASKNLSLLGPTWKAMRKSVAR